MHSINTDMVTSTWWEDSIWLWMADRLRKEKNAKRKQNKRKEKKGRKKEKTTPFGVNFNEKPSIIPGLPRWQNATVQMVFWRHRGTVLEMTTFSGVHMVNIYRLYRWGEWWSWLMSWEGVVRLPEDTKWAWMTDSVRMRMRNGSRSSENSLPIAHLHHDSSQIMQQKSIKCDNNRQERSLTACPKA